MYVRLTASAVRVCWRACNWGRRFSGAPPLQVYTTAPLWAAGAKIKMDNENKYRGLLDCLIKTWRSGGAEALWAGEGVCNGCVQPLNAHPLLAAFPFNATPCSVGIATSHSAPHRHPRTEPICTVHTLLLAASASAVPRSARLTPSLWLVSTPVVQVRARRRPPNSAMVRAMTGVRGCSGSSTST